MKIHTLGDTHLGKKFEIGVPLHRRGDREVMQFKQFQEDLETECDLHIQMGDLFDKFYVPFTVIWKAAQIYISAKRRHPNRIYALLRGNHDASRDLDKVSAFQLFTGLVRPHGIVVADDEPVRIGDHVLIPWHPVLTAVELVEKADLQQGDTVYGHWDIVMGDTNQLPAELLLSLGVVKALTGHDHNARTIFLYGLEVEVTGSMQPYSHSEDASGALYVTKSLSEVLAAPDSFVGQCLRIQLAPGEVLDQPIDCLQLTLQKGKAEDAEEIGVDFEAFDMNSLFEQARQEVGLDDEFSAKVLEKLEAERAARN